MSTVLNTIEMFEEIEISASQLATFQLIKHIRRLRRNTTNRYLSDRLQLLNEKWRRVLMGSDSKAKKSIRSNA